MIHYDSCNHVCVRYILFISNDISEFKTKHLKIVLNHGKEESSNRPPRGKS